jgi:hypothetical protein
MNEQALNYSYELFKKDGYTGTLDQYRQLISSNKEALDYSYNLFKNDGYSGSVDDFNGLISPAAERPVAQKPAEPVKKKDTVSPFVDGGSELTRFDPTSGQVVQESPEFTKPKPEVKIPEQKLPARTEFQYQPGKPLPEQKPSVQPDQPDKKGAKSYLENIAVNLGLGTSYANEAVASIPESVINILAIPQNYIAEKTGLPIGVTAEGIKESWGITNPLLDYVKEDQKILSGEVSKFMAERYEDPSIVGNFEKGNYQEGFELLGSAITQSLPISVGLMIGGAYTAPSKLATVATLGFTEDQREELADMDPTMSEAEKTLKAAGMAGMESVFSSIGTGTLGRVYKDIAKREGPETAKKIFTDGLITAYETALKKGGLPVAVAGNSLEEGAVRVGQNVISGRPIMDGVADAFITGGGSGVVFGAPISAVNAKRYIENKITSYDTKSKVTEILKDKADNMAQVYNVPVSSEINVPQLEIANLPNSRNLLINNLKKSVSDGQITEEDAKQSLFVFDKVQQVSNAVKDLNISIDDKAKVASLLRQRDDLKTKIQNKDDVLVVQEKRQIEEINNQIQSIISKPKSTYKVDGKEVSVDAIDELIKTKSKEELLAMNIEINNDQTGLAERLQAVVETKPTQQDAIQEQTAGQVPVQPGATVSEEVAQGEPQAEPQVTAEAGVQEEVEVPVINNITPLKQEGWFIGRFGKKGGITWEIPESQRETSNPNYLILQSIESNQPESKGEGSNAIAALFNMYPSATEMIFDVEGSKGFYEKIGAVGETLKREDFFKYYNSKVSSKTQPAVSPTVSPQQVEKQRADLDMEVKALEDLLSNPNEEPLFKKSDNDTKFGESADAVQDVVRQMNDLPSGNVTTTITPKPQKPIDIADLESRADAPVKRTTFDVIKGIPAVFSISDQLRIGNVTNPNTGNVIDRLFGGLGFGFTKGHEGFAWANTTKDEAQNLVNRAVSVYNNNKALFDDWWAKNPEYNGLVPLNIAKMAEGSIMSNEALYRVIKDNFSSFPKKNKVDALNYLTKNRIPSIIDSLNKSLKNPNLAKNARKSVEKRIKALTSIQTKIKDGKLKSVDQLLDPEFYGSLSLPVRAELISQLTIGSPNKPGEQKSSGLPGKNTVPRALLGIDQEASVSAKSIGEANLNKVSLSNAAETITEPAMKDIEPRQIIAIYGIDVLNPAVKETVHPNYKFGVNGRPIGVLENSVSIQEAYPFAYTNILESLIAQEEKGGEELKAAPIDSLINEKIPVGIGLPNLEFIGAVSQGIMSNAQKLSAWINKSFPSVIMSTDAETFANVLKSDGVRVQLKGDEVVYGVTVDGDIYINPDVHNSDSALFNTTIHEFGHVWLNFLETTAEGKSLLNRGINLVKKTGEYQDQLKKFNGNQTKAANEALAILIGNRGETIVNASLKSKFQEWLLGVWKYVKDKFKLSGDLTPQEIQDLNLDQFLGTAIADLFSGKALPVGEIQLKKLKNPEAAFSKSDSIDSIVQKGRANGFSEESIKIVLDKRGFTEQAINKALGKKVPVKEGVPELFKETPELASIGTTEDYSAYLDTIFPDSEVNNIAYHGSNYKFDNFKKAVNPKNVYKEGAYKAGFFFSKDKETAKSYIDNKIIAKISNALNLSAPKNPTVYPVVLDIKNPVIEDRDGKRGIGFDEVNEAYDNKNDAYIAENVKDPNIPTDVYVVFKPEQIHILGSKKDIEDFKKFVSSKPTLSAAKKVEVTEEFAPGYDRMIGELEGVVEKSLKRGTSQERAMENAINYLQGTKVYENATDVQREQMVRDVRKRFKKSERRAPSAEKVVGKPKKKEVTVDEMVALKDQIKLEARAAREAKVDLNTKRKALAARIIAARKKGTITATQARTLVNRISRVNLDNPIMVDRLIEYTDKVFDNANYAADMAELRKLQKQARSRNHTSMGNLVDRFTSINPELIPLVDKETGEPLTVIQDYKEALDFLNNRTPSYSRMNEMLSTIESYQVSDPFDAVKTKDALMDKYKSIIDNKVKTEEKDNKLKTVEDYVALIKDINSFKRKAYQLLQNEAITQEEYEDLIDGAGKNQATIEKKFSEQINKIKSDLISEIKKQRPKTNPEFTKEENDLIKEYLELSDADLESLSPEELFILNDLLENIKNGEIDVFRFGNIVSKASKNKEGIALGKQLKGSKLSLGSAELRKKMAQFESSFWEGLLGLGRATSGPLQKFIISPFNRAIGSYEKFLRDGYNDFLNLKKKLKDKKNSMNKIGMLTTYLQEYMAQFDPDNKGVDNIGKRDWFKQILDSETMRDDYSPEELKIIEEIHKSLPKDKDGNVSPEAVYKSYIANDEKFFSKDEKEFFDSVMEWKKNNSTSKQKAANEMSGNPFKEIPFHMLRSRYTGKTSQITPTTSGDNGMVRIKAGTGKERASEAVGAINTDFEKLFIKGLEQTGRDYFLSKALKDINNVLSSAKKELDGDKDPLIKAISYTLSDALTYEFSDTASQNILKRLVQARAAMTLFDPIRAGIEFTSTLLSFGLRTRTLSGYKNLFGSQGDMRNLLEFTDSPLRLRQNISNAIDINDGRIEPQGMLTKWTTFLSGLPERTMMVTSWMPTFTSEFQNITGEKFDMKKFNDSEAYREKYGKAIKDASAVADAQTEKIIGPTTKAGQRRDIIIFPGKTVGRDTVSGQILGFFSNYPYREVTEFVNGFKEAGEVLKKGDSVDALKQLQKPLGISLNVAAYGFLSSVVYASRLILLGDEDEEERGSKMLEELMTAKGFIEETAANAAALAASKYAGGGRATLQLLATLAMDLTDNEETKATIKKMLKGSVYVDPLPTQNLTGYGTVDKVNTAILKYIPQLVMLNNVIIDGLGGLKELGAIYDKVESKGIDALTKDEELRVLALSAMFTFTQLFLNYKGTSLPSYNNLKAGMKAVKEEAGVADIAAGKEPAKKKSSRGGSSRGGGMNKTDLKKYNRELYDQMYGPGSAAYEIEQEVKAFEKEQREFKKKMKDQIYGGD